MAQDSSIQIGFWLTHCANLYKNWQQNLVPCKNLQFSEKTIFNRNWPEVPKFVFVSKHTDTAFNVFCRFSSNLNFLKILKMQSQTDSQSCRKLVSETMSLIRPSIFLYFWEIRKKVCIFEKYGKNEATDLTVSQLRGTTIATISAHVPSLLMWVSLGSGPSSSSRQQWKSDCHVKIYNSVTVREWLPLTKSKKHKL